MHRFLTRGAVLAASMTLLASPAYAGDTPRDELAAGWLAAQPTSGIVHNPNFGGFDDFGLTVDLGLALSEIGGQQAVVDQIRDALALNVDTYTTGVDWGSSDVYAGSTAKLVVFAQTVGADPTTYGGVDLVARLKARVIVDGPSKGRIQDQTAGTDYANTIGQAFAVQGLAAAGSGKAVPALAFLLKQQCAKGYFRLSLTKKKSAKDQTCDGGNTATVSAPDTDATAIALLSLDALGSTNPKVLASVTSAKKWLQSRQKANGSFGGGTSTEASNSNSTGLAGWALGEVGACGAAQQAANWVARWQVDGAPLDAELGAIAYDRTGYAAATTAAEITDANRDQWWRATAQAAPALRNLVLSDCRSR